MGSDIIKFTALGAVSCTLVIATICTMFFGTNPFEQFFPLWMTLVFAAVLFVMGHVPFIKERMWLRTLVSCAVVGAATVVAVAQIM